MKSIKVRVVQMRLLSLISARQAPRYGGRTNLRSSTRIMSNSMVFGLTRMSPQINVMVFAWKNKDQLAQCRTASSTLQQVDISTTRLCQLTLSAQMVLLILMPTITMVLSKASQPLPGSKILSKAFRSSVLSSLVAALSQVLVNTQLPTLVTTPPPMIACNAL